MSNKYGYFFPSTYNMLFFRHPASSGHLLPFIQDKVRYCACCRSFLFPPFPRTLAERSLQSLLPCWLASVPLQRNIKLLVMVCSL